MPSISWKYNGVALKSSSEMVQSYNGRIAKLMFLSVKADNAGVYECTGTNNNGEVKSVATLIVQGGE